MCFIGPHIFTVNGFDAAGAGTISTTFYVTRTNPYQGDTPPDTDAWHATFDLSAATSRYAITRIETGETVFAAASTGPLSCSIQEPSAGSALGERVRLGWTASRQPPVEGSQPIRSMVFLSADNGATWDPVSLFSEATSASISTEALMPGPGIAARVVASDGVGFCAVDVTGLTLANRPPMVQIISPREGDVAAGDFAWTLQAEALDVEDGVIDSGSWSSSIDGELGAGSILEGVVLSHGAHTLAYRASDTAGATGSAEVHITVDDATAVDLFWTADALRITPPGTDPVYRPNLTVLKPGLSHSATLGLRNSGVPVVCDIELYMKTPDGAEIPIASETAVVLDSFAEHIVSTLFTPDGEGAFRFRAVVANCTPEDGTIENNERVWTFYSAETKINVTEPLGGSEHSAAGRLVIAWNYSGYVGDKVKIELLGQQGPVQAIAESVPIGANGEGSYSWIIPGDFPPDAGYRVRVTSLADGMVVAVSADPFATTPPEPTLAEVISALRIAGDMQVDAESLKYIRDVDGDGKIGVKEAVYWLRKIHASGAK